jgi:HMG (high mobility group) box
MSAFLKYSQSRRALVKLQNPDMSNTDVSRLLGEMWRLASEREKRPYVEEEERERASYKQDTAAFRAQMARVDAASRTRHGDYNDEEKDVVWDPPATEIWNVREYPTESSGSRSNFQDLRRSDSLHHGHENLSYQPHPISYPHSFPQGMLLMDVTFSSLDITDDLP